MHLNFILFYLQLIKQPSSFPNWFPFFHYPPPTYLSLAMWKCTGTGSARGGFSVIPHLGPINTAIHVAHLQFCQLLYKQVSRVQVPPTSLKELHCFVNIAAGIIQEKPRWIKFHRYCPLLPPALQLGNFFSSSLLLLIWSNSTLTDLCTKCDAFQTTTEIDLKAQFLRSPPSLRVCKDSSLGKDQAPTTEGLRFSLRAHAIWTWHSLPLTGACVSWLPQPAVEQQKMTSKKSQEAYKVKNTFDAQKMND